MKILGAAKELSPGGRKVCLAIGVFDGVHLGHQQILGHTITEARDQAGLAVALTFDRHPSAIVSPGREPRIIYTLPQKLRALAALGMDATVVIPFDAEFSRQTGGEFIHRLAGDLGGIHSLCVGADFVFGRQRSGNVELLTALGAELHFTVQGLAAVTLDGEVVSSTRIREMIRTGRLGTASRMLGRPYALSGRIVSGDRLGRKLGFPTANLDLPGHCLPPNGVYAGRTRWAGRYYRVALNLGRRPTLRFPAPELRVEAHLLDFDGDLYGQELEIEVGDRLRDEKKFATPVQLGAQIARDLQAVRENPGLTAGLCQ
jgi:riboflavin kinase/FMN adenylyltransferase